MPVLAVTAGIDPQRLEELWRDSGAEAYGFSLTEFEGILAIAGKTKNYGLPSGESASTEQRITFISKLHVTDLVLARTCADGKPDAWERFLAVYREPLLRAAISITGNATQGHDLADALYGELYGLTVREGQRQCPLDYYMGTGSLLGWLRTLLAQRHVDHYRHHRRETPLDGHDAPVGKPEVAVSPDQVSILGKALEQAIQQQQREDLVLLSAYFLDELTFQQIGILLHQHETTVGRRLRRITKGLRKLVMRNLQASGLGRRAAEEALEIDPRDLDLNLKKILQDFHIGAFPEKAGG